MHRSSACWRSERFGFIGAIIVVTIAAGLQILVEELTAARRARIAAADLAEQQQPASLPSVTQSV
jgi:hypothetical protein